MSSCERTGSYVGKQRNPRQASVRFPHRSSDGVILAALTTSFTSLYSSSFSSFVHPALALAALQPTALTNPRVFL